MAIVTETHGEAAPKGVVLILDGSSTMGSLTADAQQSRALHGQVATDDWESTGAGMHGGLALVGLVNALTHGGTQCTGSGTA
ncbi:hypothetical protein TIFTF001_007622 [Ficus carica]|uniref:Uncharacterized protein n=1 Tax=Ficus carica TaxID=3494 RepID=A0AA88A3B2_FICCA|nr:hypothetical protein TIFTF001_007622 [Ficus carica]